MTERAQSAADVAAAFGARRTATGWDFAGTGEGFRIDEAPDGVWVVGYVERNNYRPRQTFTSERAAARFVFAQLTDER